MLGFLQVRMLRQNINEMRRTELILGEPLENVIEKINDTVDYQELITAKLFGYNGSDHYFDKVSSHYVMDHITIPTLILNSKDDPIIG